MRKNNLLSAITTAFLFVSPKISTALGNKISSNSQQVSNSNPIEVTPKYTEAKKKKKRRRRSKHRREIEEEYLERSSPEDSDSDGFHSEDEEMAPSKKTSLRELLRSKLAENRSNLLLLVLVLSFYRPLFDLAKNVPLSSLSPTDIMKLVLFLDFVRKFYFRGEGAGGGFSLGGGSVFLPPIHQSFTFERVNDRHFKDAMALSKSMSAPLPQASTTPSFLRKRPPSPFSLLSQLQFPHSPLKDDPPPNVTTPTPSTNQTLLILEFKDPPAPSSHPGHSPPTLLSQITFLRHAITFLLLHRHLLPADLEILLLLESPGGSAVDYGLASSQLSRLASKIPLTISVDRVAASGGYMMASQASPGKLFASQFAIVGSIGVVSSSFNVHNLLEKYGVVDMVFRGGKSKAPLGLFGEVTEEGREVVQGMVDRVHDAFRLVALNGNRRVLEDNLDLVNGGEVFLGEEARRLGLIDEVLTSDEYIEDKVREGCVVLRMIRCEARSKFVLPWPMFPLVQMERVFSGWMERFMAVLGLAGSGVRLGGDII